MFAGCTYFTKNVINYKKMEHFLAFVQMRLTSTAFGSLFSDCM